MRQARHAALLWVALAVTACAGGPTSDFPRESNADSSGQRGEDGADAGGAPLGDNGNTGASSGGTTSSESTNGSGGFIDCDANTSSMDGGTCDPPEAGPEPDAGSDAAVDPGAP